MADAANGGLFLQEAPAGAQRIPVRRESVAAFVGAAPRGPVGIPVALFGLDDFQRRFGAPGHRCRAQDLLLQFFENGGTKAVFVRVSASARRHRLVMPGIAGNLVLQALNPGPHECLRAAVDYDGIPAADTVRFNLVVHRLSSRDRPIVEDQEIYRAVSVDPADPDFIAERMDQSRLVSVDGAVPLARPEVTRSPARDTGAAYAYTDDDWYETQPLTDYDLVGSNADGTGIFALDRVPIVDALCLVPDDGNLGPVALFAAERYCVSRHAILFIDPPGDCSRAVDLVRQRMTSAFSSSNVVTFFPRPVTRPGGGTSRSPSVLGALIGRLLANDAQLGVWGGQSPGSLNLRCRTDLACEVDDREQAMLNRVGVNTLRQFASGILQLTGMVTMDAGNGMSAPGRDLRQQRILNYVVGSIARCTRWIAFAQPDGVAWAEARAQIGDFMSELYETGAIVGPNLDTAWYVLADHHTAGFVGRGGAGTGFSVGFTPRGGRSCAWHFSHDPTRCATQPVFWQPEIARTG